MKINIRNLKSKIVGALVILNLTYVHCDSLVVTCSWYNECGSNNICILTSQQCATAVGQSIVQLGGSTTSGKHTYNQNGYSITWDPNNYKVRIVRPDGFDSGFITMHSTNKGCLTQGQGVCDVQSAALINMSDQGDIKGTIQLTCSKLSPEVYSCADIIKAYGY